MKRTDGEDGMERTGWRGRMERTVEKWEGLWPEQEKNVKEEVRVKSAVLWVELLTHWSRKRMWRRRVE